jgi:hypothetical protein
MKLDELEYRLICYAKKGGKTSRKKQCNRIRQFIRFCASDNSTTPVRGPDQIGNKQVWLWYYKKELQKSTERDRYYAVCFLWEMLGRKNAPPIPFSLRNSIAKSKDQP